MLKHIDATREYLPTPQAAKRANVTRLHIARLLRDKKLEGFQFGREWFVYVDSLEHYLASPRKTGPKKKQPITEQMETSQDAQHATTN
jgi:excisionase family DNA binding protein